MRVLSGYWPLAPGCWRKVRHPMQRQIAKSTNHHIDKWSGRWTVVSHDRHAHTKKPLLARNFNDFNVSHATFMRRASDVHAMRMRRASLAQAWFMRRSCDTHATGMRRPCDGYATGMRRYAINKLEMRVLSGYWPLAPGCWRHPRQRQIAKSTNHQIDKWQAPASMGTNRQTNKSRDRQMGLNVQC